MNVTEECSTWASDSTHGSLTPKWDEAADARENEQTTETELMSAAQVTGNMAAEQPILSTVKFCHCASALYFYGDDCMQYVGLLYISVWFIFLIVSFVDIVS